MIQRPFVCYASLSACLPASVHVPIVTTICNIPNLVLLKSHQHCICLHAHNRCMFALLYVRNGFAHDQRDLRLLSSEMLYCMHNNILRVEFWQVNVLVELVLKHRLHENAQQIFCLHHV